MDKHDRSLSDEAAFAQLLETSLPEQPPADVAQSVTPWRQAVGRILWGLVLTSVTVVAVLKRLGADSVTVISRSGEDNYDNIQKHADARIIVNTTPLGMYPNNGQAAVNLETFPEDAAAVPAISPTEEKQDTQPEEAAVAAVSGGGADDPFAEE